MWEFFKAQNKSVLLWRRSVFASVRWEGHKGPVSVKMEVTVLNRVVREALAEKLTLSKNLKEGTPNCRASDRRTLAVEKTARKILR